MTVLMISLLIGIVAVIAASVTAEGDENEISIAIATAFTVACAAMLASTVFPKMVLVAVAALATVAVLWLIEGIRE